MCSRLFLSSSLISSRLSAARWGCRRSEGREMGRRKSKVFGEKGGGEGRGVVRGEMEGGERRRKKKEQ